MEFLKKHKKITENEINRLKKHIIESLKKKFEIGRTAESSIKNLSIDLHNNFICKSFIYKYRGYFENCLIILNNHKSLYDSKKTDSIYNTLNNEIYEIFISKIEIAKKQEYIKEDFNDLTYESFVKHLLSYYVQNNFYNKLESEEGYFLKLLELFYEIDDYSQFDNSFFSDHEKIITLEKVEKIFNMYNKKLILENFGGQNNLIETQKKISSDLNNELKDSLKEFSIDEKYIILHALYKVIEIKKYENRSLDLAEFLRVIRICQDIDDITLFQTNYTKKFYNQVSKGLDYSTNTNFKKKIKENLTKKLADLKVPEVYDYIKSLKN
ncbi:MAG: hypothetical protein KYX68_08090 [Flavobacterium sp.]|nr:hypothetical protein [Flavobacterium sp.]